MSIINSSYFVGERNIPNKTALDVGSLIVNLLNIYEPRFLTDALGYELFSAFKAGLIAAPPHPQRYLDILLGANFTGLDGRPTRWEGLMCIKVAAPTTAITIDGNAITIDTSAVPLKGELVSPLADYVYFYWLRKKNSQTGDVGETQSTSENSRVVSPRYKMTHAWNDMVEKACKLHEFLTVNWDTYPEFQSHSGSRDNRLLLTKINPYF